MWLVILLMGLVHYGQCCALIAQEGQLSFGLLGAFEFQETDLYFYCKGALFIHVSLCFRITGRCQKLIWQLLNPRYDAFSVSFISFSVTEVFLGFYCFLLAFYFLGSLSIKGQCFLIFEWSIHCYLFFFLPWQANCMVVISSNYCAYFICAIQSSNYRILISDLFKNTYTCMCTHKLTQTTIMCLFSLGMRQIIQL